MTMNYDELLYVICESKILDDTLDAFLESNIGNQVLKISRTKFLKDHDYDKDTKTIKLSGKRYKVDPGFSSKMKISSIDGAPIYTARTTSADTKSDDPKIYLDKDFFKILGKKSKEAVIQHEVGHLKMHSMSPDSKIRDKAFASKNTFADMIKANLVGFDNETKKEVVREALKDPGIKKIMQQKSGEISDADRKAVRQIMKKYAHGGHSNPTELEADRYAANRTSNSALTSGLSQYQFHASRTAKKAMNKAYSDIEDRLKRNPKDKEMYDALTPGGDYLASVKSAGKKNMVMKSNAERKELFDRVRALHDKKLQNADMYKRESREENAAMNYDELLELVVEYTNTKYGCENDLYQEDTGTVVFSAAAIAALVAFGAFLKKITKEFNDTSKEISNSKSQIALQMKLETIADDMDATIQLARNGDISKEEASRAIQARMTEMVTIIDKLDNMGDMQKKSIKIRLNRLVDNFNKRANIK